MSAFVHLHVHTQYSLLDGAIRLKDLIETARSYGMPALAMTDHGNMFGALEFYEKAKKAGIKPILGCEMYLAPRSHRDRQAKGGNGGNEQEDRNYHLVLLAKDRTGYQNLLKLVSKAHLEGFYYKPRIDKEQLKEHHEGLIALSACLKGEIAGFLLRNQEEAARNAALEYAEIMGRGNFYLEIQANGIPEQTIVNEGMIRLGRELNLPLVATNDCHYLRRNDARAHEILLCIQTGKTVLDEKRMKFQTDQLYFKSPEEMTREFSHVPDALENTAVIADQCDLKIETDQYHFPIFPLEEGESVEDRFRKAVREGMQKRFRQIRKRRPTFTDQDEKEYEARLTYEMDVICQMEFPAYFLIVSDFINYAKDRGIPVGPGRGSAAGSLVAYAMGITDLDPIEHSLIFERFLNIERISMPDIDVDFCIHGREEVFRYVAEKYGKDRVAQIATFGTMQARAVIRDVGRALAMPYNDVDRIAKLIPSALGITLQKAFEQEPRLSEMQREDPRLRELFEVALALEGLTRHASTHAAGVVIGDKPIVEYMPLFRGKDEEGRDEVVTQYSMKYVEKAGLIKFDFLGLRNLTVINNAIQLIRKNHGVDLNLDELNLEDKETYDLLSRAETTGVFQLESSGMRDILVKLRPENFADIVALVALYRPGPLESGMVDHYIQGKHGQIEVTYDPEILRPILEPTYGVILYQEQVMSIASVLANYTLGEADILRRAMGKKIPEVMQAQRSRFLSGAKENKLDMAKASHIFDLMEKFAGYGFNRCVHGDTQIIDADTGEKTTVESLFKHRRPFRVHALGDDGQLRARKVENVFWNGRKPVLELITAQGKRIVATANHPFRTLNGWTNLEELKPGDSIAAPRRLPLAASESWPQHELITLAGLLSEGNTCHPTCLYFYGNERESVDDFAQAVENFPDTVARIDERANGRLEVCVSTGRDMRFSKGMVPWNARAVADGNAAVTTQQLPIRSGAFRWTQSLGILGKKATEKFVPEPVFRLRDAALEIFIGRLWAGDGFFANAKQAIPFYATSSPELARDLQILLLRLGIISGIHSKSFNYRGGTRPGYTVHLLGEDSVEIFVKRIAPHAVGRHEQVEQLIRHLNSTERGKTSKDTIPVEVREWINEERLEASLTWDELAEQAGLCARSFWKSSGQIKRGYRRTTITKVAQSLGSERLEQIAGSDVFWDRVVAIQPRGIADTYDLTVEEDHNFVADGLIVHNSHSAAYALIAYQTAYLKAHYPVEFMAALLNSFLSSTDQVVKLINECREKNITILPPDVNASDKDFTVVKGEIRFGLGAVKNVGESAIEVILNSRRDQGPFETLHDFCERMDTQKVNRRVLEQLIKCGAFDSIHPGRAQVLAALDSVLERAQVRQKDRQSGQVNMFDLMRSRKKVAPPSLPDVPDWDTRTCLQFEKEAIGFYISGHPLDSYTGQLTSLCITDSQHIREKREESIVILCGMLNITKELTTKKKGERMAFISLEDKEGIVEIVVFPNVFALAEPLLREDEPRVVIGKVQHDERGSTILADRILKLEDAQMEAVESVRIRLHSDSLNRDELTRLLHLLMSYPGESKTFLHLMIEEEAEAVIALPKLQVNPSQAFLQEMSEHFGPECVEAVPRRLSENSA